MKILKICFYIIIINLLVITACRFEVPIKEMIQARILMQKASKVKAEKYANDLLEKSKASLIKCHDWIKAEKKEEAKKAALNSQKLAQQAIDKALPLLAKDSLNGAKKIFEEAKKLYAEKFSSDEFTKAGTLLKDADKKNKEKKYWDAHITAKQAYEVALKAKTNAAGKIPNLKNEIGELKLKVDALALKDTVKSAENDLKDIKSTLDKASTALLNNTIKEAVTFKDEAKKKLETISIKIEKVAAKNKVKKLREEVTKLKNERGLKYANDDIDIVLAALNKADTLLDQDNVQEAVKNINNAETALTIAKNKTNKGIAKEKIDAVEKLITTTKTKDSKNEYNDKITQAEDLVKKSKDDLNNNLFKESIAKSGQAATILNTITFASNDTGNKDTKDGDITKDGSDKDGSGTDSNKETNTGTNTETKGKDFKKYTVKYNKRNPDCLWKIALRVYRNAKLWPIIYKANREKIKDPDLIFPGQSFVIPPRKKKIIKDDTSKGKDDDSIVMGENKGKGENKKNDSDTKDKTKNKTKDENNESNNTTEKKKENDDSLVTDKDNSDKKKDTNTDNTENKSENKIKEKKKETTENKTKDKTENKTKDDTSDGDDRDLDI